MKAIVGGCAILLGLGMGACTADRQQAGQPAPVSSASSVSPSSMPRVGTLDERYQSYNVEMLEVTGGRFWKPYQDIPKIPGQTGPKPAAPTCRPA